MRKFSTVLLAGVATVAITGASWAQLSSVSPSGSANKLAAQAQDSIVQKPAQMGALTKASNASAAMAMGQSVGVTTPTSKLGSASISGAPQDARLSSMARPSRSAAQLATVGAPRDLSSALGRSSATGNMIEVGRGTAPTQAAK